MVVARLAKKLTLMAALSSLALSPLTAQGASPARAHLLQGYQLKKQGQLREALPHLEESFRLEPKLQTLINLADCEEQLGLLVEARDHWRLAAAQGAREADTRTQAGADARAGALEQRLPHLTLQLASGLPADATVYRNEGAVPLASLGVALPVNPGEQRIVVRAMGRQDWSRVLTLAERDRQMLTVLVGPAGTPSPAPPPPSPARFRSPQAHAAAAAPANAAPLSATAPAQDKGWSPGSTQRKLGIAAGVTGVVSLAVSTLFWMKANKDIRSPIDGRAKAESDILVTNITLVSGLVLLGGGVVLFAASPPQQQAAVGLRVSPSFGVSSRAVALGAVGEF